MFHIFIFNHIQNHEMFLNIAAKAVIIAHAIDEEAALGIEPLKHFQGELIGGRFHERFMKLAAKTKQIGSCVIIHAFVENIQRAFTKILQIQRTQIETLVAQRCWLNDSAKPHQVRIGIHIAQTFLVQFDMYARTNDGMLRPLVMVI